jgi:hypothetical protein
MPKRCGFVRLALISGRIDHFAVVNLVYALALFRVTRLHLSLVSGRTFAESCRRVGEMAQGPTRTAEALRVVSDEAEVRAEV